MYRPSTALTPVLYIPGKIYQTGVYLRNRAFDAGLIPVRRLTRPTVSVGNLTLGGTGKTPFVIYLSGLFEEMGYKTAILTRGYGRRKSGKTIILKQGENRGLPASLLGDEPALIRRRLSESWLGISSDRFCAAHSIERQIKQLEQTNQVVFVLDDGFQHRGIHRDLDIVMIDRTNPPDDDSLFPLRTLREPASELRRAHVVVINGSVPSDDGGIKNIGNDALIDRLRKYAPQAEYFNCLQSIKDVLPFPLWLDSKPSHNLRESPGTVFLTAAIGNPQRFKRDIQNMGFEVRGCTFFKDHAGIGEKGWKMCVESARKAKAEAIIITEKDAVKITRPPDFPLLVAVQNTELSETVRFREMLARIFIGFLPLVRRKRAWLQGAHGDGDEGI